MMKRSCRTYSVVLVALAAVAAPAGAVAPVRIVYRGHTIHTTAPVVQFAHGTLVPLRPVVAAVGGSMEWTRATQTAVVRYRGRRLEVDERARKLRLNGQPMAGLPDSRRAHGQLLVPLAGLERFYGTRARWLPKQRLLSFAALPAPRPVIGHAASGVIQRPGANTQQASRASGLQLRLTSDRSAYKAGDPVMLTLTVTNPGATPVTLQFPSAQQYDFEVRRGGQAIWRWSAGRMFTQALTSLTIGPGEKRVFTQTWNQRDDNGQAVAAGSYEAVGTLTTMDRPQPQSPPLALRIGS
jgi:hypothetical protein